MDVFSIVPGLTILETFEQSFY